jgi:hypothetical protein
MDAQQRRKRDVKGARFLVILVIACLLIIKGNDWAASQSSRWSTAPLTSVVGTNSPVWIPILSIYSAGALVRLLGWKKDRS